MEKVKTFRLAGFAGANVVDWAELNRIRYRAGEAAYLGNFMDDDSLNVWALFGIEEERYCVLIDK